MIFLENSPPQNAHFHEEVELLLVEKGDITCMVSGEETIIKEGELALIGKGALHRLSYGTVPSEISCLQIGIDSICKHLFPDESLFSYFCTVNSKKYGIYTSDSQVKQIFNFIRSEIQRKDIHYNIAVRGAVYQLVAFMSREELIEDGSYFINNRSYQKILPALEYTRENFATKITLDTLCDHLKLDKYNFCKLFKKVTGTNYFDYLLFIRLKHSEELLLYTNKSITEISFESCFSSVQYFTRAFTKKFGCRPTEYRNMIAETDIAN